MAMPEDTSRLWFKNLTDLIKTLLVLPHGNVNPRRLFSMDGKVQTEQRGSFILATTVRDVISVKMNALNGTPCYQAGDKLFTSQLIRETNTATMRSLKNDSREQ